MVRGRQFPESQPIAFNYHREHTALSFHRLQSKGWINAPIVL